MTEIFCVGFSVLADRLKKKGAQEDIKQQIFRI